MPSLIVQTPIATTRTSRSIAFISTDVENYDLLLAKLDDNIETYLLNSEQDGIQQIVAILQGRTLLESIHILSHGDSGSLFLGTSVVNNDNLSNYSNALNQIGASLAKDGNILLYGCNVAKGEAGLQFINQLAQYARTNIAASSTLTGSEDLGGNWFLDVVNTGGMITTKPLAIPEYDGVLITVATDQSNYDLSFNSAIDNAIITANDIALGSTVIFQVQHITAAGPDGILGTADDVLGDNTGAGHTPWSITDGGAGDLDGLVNGSIQTSWYITPDDSLNQQFLVTANNGAETATTLFTTKTFYTVTEIANVPGGTADVAGEVINYTVTITNTGTTSISRTTVSNPLPNLTLISGDTVNPGRLDVGETWVYTASHTVTQAEIDAGGKIDNTTTVTAAGIEPPVIKSASASTTIEQKPSLNVATTVSSISGGTPDNKVDGAGDVINYNIVLTNSGNQTLNGINVQDPFATTLSSSHTESGGTGTNNDGILDVGETWVYTATHTVTQAEIDAANPLVNTATATTTNPALSQQGSATVNVLANPAFTIEKQLSSIVGGTVDGKVDSSGDIINYSIILTNKGNQTLTGVTIQDVFAPNPLLQSGDVNNNGKLDVGEAWTYNASHTVTQAEINTGAALVNVATATTDQLKTPLSSNSVSTPIASTASFSIQKTASVPGGTADIAGEIIDYTIQVANTGNTSIADLVVTDPNVTNLKLQSGDANNDGKLDTNETWTYTASHAVSQAEIDTSRFIVNTATANSASLNLSQQASATVVVEQKPSVTIVKQVTSVTGGTANNQVDSAGDIINYRIDLTNTGNQTLTYVSFNDPFAVIVGNPIESGGKGVNGDGRLDVGETWTYTATHTVTPTEFNAGTALQNIATVTTLEIQTPQQSNTTTTAIANTPSFTIVKTASVPGGTADVVGEIIDYTIKVANTGNTAIADIAVTDPSVTNLILQSGDANNDGKLDINETWTYAASHAVSQADIDTGKAIVNTATASSASLGLNQQSSATVIVEQKPSFSINKQVISVTGGTANNEVDSVGDIINYNIVLTNTGNQTLTNVNVQDNFAPNPTLQSGDTNNNGKLDVGEIWTYIASHTVTQAEMTAGAALVNVANASTLETATLSSNTVTTLIVPQTQPHKILHIEKDASVACSCSNVVKSVGQQIDYTIAVTNLGDSAIANVQVSDPFVTNLAAVIANGFNIGDTNRDRLLDINETWRYTASHSVTQADLDKGGSIVNTATVTGDAATPASDSANVLVEQKPELQLDKVTVYRCDSGDDLKGVIAGDDIGWEYTVYNTGNVSLANILIKDDNGTAGNTNDDFLAKAITEAFNGNNYNIGDINHDNLLNPDEVWHFNASGIAVLGDYCNIATVSGSINDTTVTASDGSSYESSYCGCGHNNEEVTTVGIAHHQTANFF